MEVLISAFIMAVGLLGVAALLPVAHHEANKGLIADRAAVIARQAFRDFQIRGEMPGPKTVAQIRQELEELAQEQSWDFQQLQQYLQDNPQNPRVMTFPPDPILPPEETAPLDWTDTRPRFRSADDGRYTYLVWAARVPYADSELGDITDMDAENLSYNLMLNYVPQNQSSGTASQGAQIHVVIFVFFNEDKHVFNPSGGQAAYAEYIKLRQQQQPGLPPQHLFDPKNPGDCPPQNRPVAIYEKMLSVEGTSSWKR
jgi:hypothetical protein